MLSAYRAQRKIRGNSLTEVAIVVGVMGVILGGIWAAANYVLEQVKKERFAEQVTMVVNNVRAFYQNQPGIKGTTDDVTADVVENKLVPKEMVASSTTATHAWGKKFTVAPIVEDGTYKQSFKITFEDLKQDPCISVAYYLTGSKAPVGLTDISIDGSSIKIPIKTVGDVTNACKTESDLVATYRLRAPR